MEGHQRCTQNTGRGGCKVAGGLKTSLQVCWGNGQEVEEAVGGGRMKSEETGGRCWGASVGYALSV